MKIIFAQGNPGLQYKDSRHNIGFLAADRIVDQWGDGFSKKPKFFADIAEITIEGQKALIVKPTTFYNETGQSARLICDFYKLDPKKDFLAIYDDLALPLGVIRTRLRGSDAGNNGVKSLNMHLGDEYARIRIGIFNQQKTHIPSINFVLGMFDTQEKNTLNSVVEQVELFALSFITGQFQPTKVTLAPEA